MSVANKIVQDRHNELLRASDELLEANTTVSEDRYRQIGQKYRTVPSAQGPLLGMMLLLTNGDMVELKYAYITERFFIRHDTKEAKNLIVIRVRDSMQIKIAGYNLARLNEDLLRQVVLDIGAVSELAAAAALKANPNMPVISSVTIEYGRMDMENGMWMPGGGSWSDVEQRWVPSAAPPL